MNERLNQIRARTDKETSIQQKLMRVLFSFLLGALLGFLAKYFDNVPYIGAIGTHLGVWILIATLLAAWSRSPKAAALHVFMFFTAMLIAYYAYSMVLFGFFPRYYFLSWGGIALLSPVGAYIVWYARGTGWMAALCAALPIALLLVEGYSFFYTGSIPRGGSILAAVILTIVLGRTASQSARIALLAAAAALILRQLDILSLLFGGL
jgi:hypothetical protein